jgi:glycosyltransferase involved in cell wall biosynthesis
VNWPPKISIITPSYNQAQYLEQTIMSILGQGYPNLEYIVIDGGSSDGSVEIIKRYSDKLAYWHSRSDRGQADAINQGLKKATGEIFAYLNSDDKLIEGAFWKIAYLARQEPTCDLFCCANFRFAEDGGVHYECPRPWIPGGPLGCLQDATFWRASVHEKIGYFDETFQFALCNDFFSRILCHHRSLYHSDPISMIRQHPLQKTATMGDVSRAEATRLREKYKHYTVPYSWRCRANALRWLAGFTSRLAQLYITRWMWGIEMPPIEGGS